VSADSATLTTVAHDVIRVGDPVYLHTMHGGRMAATVVRAEEYTPTGLLGDAKPYGWVKITARRPLPGYSTGETLHNNDLSPRTGWHTSNGRYYRVGVSCLEWQQCQACGRTTRVETYAVKLRHDAVTVTVIVINGNAAKAATLARENEGAPPRSVESVT
jgi:hypothetical protein